MRVRSTIPVFAALLLGVGCSSPDSVQGEPSPAPPVSDTATDKPAEDVAQVKDPVDTTRFRQDPCGLVAVDRLAQLKVPNSRAEPAPDREDGPTCTWKDDSGTLISVQFMDKLKRGVSEIYGRQKSLADPVFKPVPEIDGYPAVFLDSVPKQPGRCGIAFGVTDTQAIYVSSINQKTAPRYGDTCRFVQEFAENALATAKGGN